MFLLFLNKINYCFFLVSAQTPTVLDEPNMDFVTSTTIDITLVPANVSVPGLLNPVDVPARIPLN